MRDAAALREPQAAVDPLHLFLIIAGPLFQAEKILLRLRLRQAASQGVIENDQVVDVAHQHTETAAGDDVLIPTFLGLRFLLRGHLHLVQFLVHEPLQILGVAEHQVATGDAPALELLLGDLTVPLRRIQHMEHILLILDAASQKSELVEEPIQVDLIVDVGEIGLAVDDIQFVFHIHASVSAACSTSLGLVVSNL